MSKEGIEIIRELCTQRRDSKNLSSEAEGNCRKVKKGGPDFSLIFEEF